MFKPPTRSKLKSIEPPKELYRSPSGTGPAPVHRAKGPPPPARPEPEAKTPSLPGTVRFGGGSAAALVAFGLGSSACLGVEPRLDAAEPLPVDALAVHREPGHPVVRRFAGTVRARRESLLGFERSGRVVRLDVDEGDRVRPGQVLGRLDVARLRVRQRQLQAALKEAEAQVGLSEVTNSRLEKLSAKAFASRQSHDEARFGLAAAKASADRLRAQLEAVRVDLKKSRLVAPFGGVVADRLIDEGSVVSAGAPVLRFQERDGQEAAVGVPVTLARDLEEGSVHPLTIGGRSLSGVLESKVEDLDPRTRTSLLIFRIESEAPASDGEVAKVQIERWIETPGYWVPLGALSEGDHGLWSVYRLVDEPDGRASVVRRESVEVLHAESERVFVRGTLEEGDRIIRAGLHRVVPGQRVSPLPAVEPAKTRGDLR